DMLGVFSEFETNLRRERQMEGIAKAKAVGAYKGHQASIDAARIREIKAPQPSPRRSALAGRASTGCWKRLQSEARWPGHQDTRWRIERAARSVSSARQTAVGSTGFSMRTTFAW